MMWLAMTLLVICGTALFFLGYAFLAATRQEQ
jgi:hypothetical protein